MSIVTDYKISFGVNRIHNTDFKFINTASPSLDAVLFEFRSVSSCDGLLKGISLKLANSPESEDFLYTTQGLQMIKIGYSITQLYHNVEEYEANKDMIANYTLPTTDFKEIVEVWRNFIYTGKTSLT